MATVVCGRRGCGACLWTGWTRWTKWTRWGRHRIPRGFAVPQCGWARVIDVPLGNAGFLMATVVCGRRGGALVSDLSDLSDLSDQSDLSDLSDKLVRPCIPRGFAVPLCVWVRVIDVPMGNAGFLMATGVCSLRGRDACIRLIRPIRLIR